MSRNVTVTVSDKLHRLMQLNREDLSPSRIFQKALLKAIDDLEEKRKRLTHCRFCEAEIDPIEVNNNTCGDCERITKIVKNCLIVNEERKKDDK